MPGDPEQPAAFIEAVGRFIDDNALLPPSAAVLVGVSGGADSVALLAVLRELSADPARGYSLTVGHLHHGLRADADGDEQFVIELSRGWSIPCIVDRCNAAAEAKDAGESVEQAARRLRYAFFLRAARQSGAGHVAVGHHADDNAETILHRVIRGTHLRGLSGIRPRRRIGDSQVHVVRPLLRVRRSEIEAFCRASGLSWRTDHTNADTGYRRNFIRHELLPLLRERINPAADEALLRLGKAAAEAEALLSAEAARALEAARRQAPADGQVQVVLDRAELAGRPPLIAACALRKLMEEANVPMRELGMERFEELLALLDPAGPAAVPLGGGWRMRREADAILLEREGSAPDAAVGPLAVECPGETVLGDGRRIVCRIGPFDRQAFERHCRERPEGVELLDADRVEGPLRVRSRHRGDAFHPLGAPGRQTVSDFLTNLKLPRHERQRILCLCDGSGIACLLPLRIDERVKVTTDTRRVLRISVATP
ncbi:MAG TPA: tRNA lysidine(34) synthetase TilS [Phycisphaerae bacterium]|nr:tRNA lysidine(34) synthetase TilS [Phycisphaerae bacterium]